MKQGSQRLPSTGSAECHDLTLLGQGLRYVCTDEETELLNERIEDGWWALVRSRQVVRRRREKKQSKANAYARKKPNCSSKGDHRLARNHAYLYVKKENKTVDEELARALGLGDDDILLRGEEGDKGGPARRGTVISKTKEKTTDRQKSMEEQQQYVTGGMCV